MRVLTSNFPSKGFGSTVTYVDINPLNYRELTLYSSVDDSKMSELSKFIWDFENIVMTIRDWDKLSMFDVMTIISLRKFNSISKDNTFTLSNGVKFSLKDVEFSDIDSEIMNIKSIEIGGLTFNPSIKSMKDFYSSIKGSESRNVTSLKTAVLSAYLGGPSEFTVEGSTYSDIAMCEHLYSKVISHPKVKIKEGEEVVLVGSASKLFQYTIKHNRLDISKIKTS